MLARPEVRSVQCVHLPEVVHLHCFGCQVWVAVRLHTGGPDHAQYIAQYLQLLKSDSRAIFTAAAKARQALAYLKAFSDAKVMAA
jgi:antirestriction protein ArdC